MFLKPLESTKVMQVVTPSYIYMNRMFETSAARRQTANGTIFFMSRVSTWYLDLYI